jgi:hypothetical protein
LKEIADELEVISVEDDDLSSYDDALAECLFTMWNSTPIKHILKRANELGLANVNVSLDSLE